MMRSMLLSLIVCLLSLPVAAMEQGGKNLLSTQSMQNRIMWRPLDSSAINPHGQLRESVIEHHTPASGSARPRRFSGLGIFPGIASDENSGRVSMVNHVEAISAEKIPTDKIVMTMMVNAAKAISAYKRKGSDSA